MNGILSLNDSIEASLKPLNCIGETTVHFERTTHNIFHKKRVCPFNKVIRPFLLGSSPLFSPMGPEWNLTFSQHHPKINAFFPLFQKWVFFFFIWIYKNKGEWGKGGIMGMLVNSDCKWKGLGGHVVGINKSLQTPMWTLFFFLFFSFFFLFNLYFGTVLYVCVILFREDWTDT